MSRVSGSSRVPGRTVLARRMPSPTDTMEITRQKPTVRTPTRPRRRTSPMPATPTISEETTSGTTVISSERRNSWPAGSAMCQTTQVSSGESGPSSARADAAKRRADHEPEEDADVQRDSPTRLDAIVGVLVEIGHNFTFKWFHVEGRFYSAVGRNNMSAKHGRHQGSPQPESARSPHDTARGAAHERSASSPDLSKLRKNSGCPGSREQPRRQVVPLPRLRRSVAVVGRPLVDSTDRSI